MWFYWIVTIVSAGFVRIASGLFYGKNSSAVHKIGGVIFVALATSVFCLVAAFRDPYHVGVDTGGYGIEDFVAARDLSWETFSTIPRLNRYAYMIKFIIWIVSHGTQSFFIYLFVYQLLTCLPIIIISILYLKKNSWLAIIVYGCMMYPSTFNAMRQYEAEAFCLVAIFLLMRDRPIWAGITFVIACHFHTSAFVMVPIFPLYYYLKWNEKIGLKNIYIKCGVALLCAVIGCTVFSKPIFTFLFAHSETYRAYVNETIATGFALITFFAVFFFIFSVMFLLFKKKKNAVNHEIYFLLVICLIGVIGFSLGLRWKWLFRLGLYWYIAAILFFPKLTSCLEDKHEIVLMSLVIVLFLMSYSYFNYDFKNHDAVVPYMFSNNLTIRL